MWFSVAFIAGVLGDAMFVTGNLAIYMTSTRPSDATLIPLPFKNISSPYGIAFSPLDGRIYWTDRSRNFIMRSTIDGKYQEIIHSNLDSPLGIALDLVGGNIYWIDSGGRTIEVSKLNGDYRRTLISLSPSIIRDIALDTTRGYASTLCFARSELIRSWFCLLPRAAADISSTQGTMSALFSKNLKSPKLHLCQWKPTNELSCFVKVTILGALKHS